MQWPNGLRCPVCANTGYCTVSGRTHPLYQRSGCRHQTSLTAGSLFQSTKLPLTIWFLAIYLCSQAKTGLPSLALHRQLGVSLFHRLDASLQAGTRWPSASSATRFAASSSLTRPTAALIAPGAKSDAARRTRSPLRCGGVVEPSRQPFVRQAHARQELHHNGDQGVGGQASRPRRPDTKLCLTVWHASTPQRRPVEPLPFMSSAPAKPRDLPQFKWVNTVLGNLKTSFAGAYDALSYAKYAAS